MRNRIIETLKKYLSIVDMENTEACETLIQMLPSTEELIFDLEDYTITDNWKSFKQLLMQYEQLKKESEQLEHVLKVLRENSSKWNNNIEFDKRPSIILLYKRIQEVNKQMLDMLNSQVIFK